MSETKATALILFSHGSTLCGAAQALRDHAQRLADRGTWARVEVGFLNFSSPAFRDVVDEVVRVGLGRVVIVPFFLVPGKFVREDLAREVEAARQRHPEVEFAVAGCIGYDERLAEAVAELAAQERGPERWREALVRAASFCEGRPDCPLYGQPPCRVGAAGQPPAGAVSNDDGAQREAATALASAVLDERPPAEEERWGPAELREAALVVMLHGSPYVASNEPALRVIDDVRRRGAFREVVVGYLECNEPPIVEALRACVERGARRIVALPYFLHLGTHVACDLPALLDEARLTWPEVEFRLTPFLGQSLTLTEILAQRAAETSGSEEE